MEDTIEDTGAPASSCNLRNWVWITPKKSYLASYLLKGEICNTCNFNLLQIVTCFSSVLVFWHTQDFLVGINLTVPNQEKMREDLKLIINAIEVTADMEWSGPWCLVKDPEYNKPYLDNCTCVYVMRLAIRGQPLVPKRTCLWDHWICCLLQLLDHDK